MVGTAQMNCTGAPVAAEVQKLKMGMCKCIFWQHRMPNLCYVVWPDNNKVKTLSNFHTPDVLEAGLGMLRKMRVDGRGCTGEFPATKRTLLSSTYTEIKEQTKQTTTSHAPPQIANVPSQRIKPKLTGGQYFVMILLQAPSFGNVVASGFYMRVPLHC